MRIIECEQGSEQWEVMRMTRPTASNFGRIITPKKMQLSASHRDYACELVAKQIGVFVDSPPSFWMDWGTEHEPQAVEAYCQRLNTEVERVGFVLPDDTDTYGGSPDAFVYDRAGVLEVKCPKPETLIRYHWDGVLPDDYIAQVQGLLLITGCAFCDFFAWHPELQPFYVRVEPDEKFHDKLRGVLDEFHQALEELKAKVSKSGVHVIKWGE